MAKNRNWEKTREDWRELVQDLIGDITKWSKEQKWQVHLEERQLLEENLGKYLVPDVLIRLPEGRITVEVVGRNTVGAEGRVDILAFPTLSRMLLVRVGNQWKIKTDSQVEWPEPWNKKTFVKLAKLVASSK